LDRCRFQGGGLILVKTQRLQRAHVLCVFPLEETKMNRDIADKRNRAVESQRVTATKGNVQVADKTAEVQRRLQDALEDDEVREALKRLHAGQQNG
jgi:hypothetical protein